MKLSWDLMYKLIFNDMEIDVPDDIVDRLTVVFSSDTFDDRERYIIKERWQNHRTYESIAHDLGVTNVRVSQIDRLIIQKCKRSSAIKEYLATGTYVTTINSTSSIDKLRLSVRVTNALKRAGITNVGLLCAYNELELAKVRNLGSAGIQEIKGKLQLHGLDIMKSYAPSLEAPIHTLGLTSRVETLLKRWSIYSVGGLISITEKDLSRMKGLGAKGMEEIKTKLKENGLHLRDSVN